jgi:hypothetical protein
MKRKKETHLGPKRHVWHHSRPFSSSLSSQALSPPLLSMSCPSVVVVVAVVTDVFRSFLLPLLLLLLLVVMVEVPAECAGDVTCV